MQSLASLSLSARQGLHGYVGFSLAVASGGYSLAVQGLLIAVSSAVKEHGL